ncbi:LysM domain-containing protein [Actinidia chinensis var. chinensis]|uniref:LysM domain-containing protein n=1 Tax=Actinidia chinensis var. chinensis TaxID=1590841 RepID=A0A2R6QA30_ACTCC|nr:LysM domain-containing protein [Actinidia chinensis var. chinensis]
MAKISNKNTMFLNIVLVLSLLLVITMAQGSSIQGDKAKPTDPFCDLVVGAEKGDTCFGIAKAFDLTTDFFNFLNPNLNCDDIFVGQWLCIAGSAN